MVEEGRGGVSVNVNVSVRVRWAVKYDLTDLVDHPRRVTSHCWNMFAPHCELEVSGQWRPYKSPVPSSEQSRNVSGVDMASRKARSRTDERRCGDFMLITTQVVKHSCLS